MSRLAPAVFSLVVVLGTASVLAFDADRAERQRIDDLHDDLARATFSVFEDTSRPQLALDEFAGSMDTVLAALNARPEHFADGLTQLQELFPDARAMHVATSPGQTVAILGDTSLLEPFERASAASFCVDGRSYAVMATTIGQRGWVALALDTEPVLARARAAANQPVSVGLVERGAVDVLADGRGQVCGAQAGLEHERAAAGRYGVGLAPRPGGTTGIGYSPILGTSLSVLVEDDADNHQSATFARRAAILGLGGFVWTLGYLWWRIRSRGSDRLET